MTGTQESAVPPKKLSAGVRDEKYEQEPMQFVPCAELEKLYVLPDKRAVDAFVRQNRSVHSVLLAAKAALDKEFGAASIKTLRVFTDDENSISLFCFIACSSSLENAMKALRSFDQKWWLDHCQRVAGKLNFDFELI